MPTHAFIAGCSSLTLTTDERAFFRDADPWGFILFRRNIDTPEQVRALTSELRACTGRVDTPILIDQEGGRVQRLGPPHWPKYPPARRFGDIGGNDPVAARDLCRMAAMLMAHDLLELGINVDCVPVLDVPVEGAHDVIGDRAYAWNAEHVAILGRAAAEGLLAAGVLPVIKHIPGHGRAGADSHLALPIVNASRRSLRDSDFVPFRCLADMPAAMSAHVVYTAIDDASPATTSAKVIRSVIRREIGFDGLLMSDDLSMKALRGSFAERTAACFKAGIDVVLHCNGNLAEMQAVASESPKLSGKAKRRAKAALARLKHVAEPFDRKDARVKLDEAMAEGLRNA
ncbi:MAG: beta-N-acetylhexosaminidase [Beijerinckiaceae bacterium]|nr:beta-N-acetylhexosaminidase [Beijerinckiaceae bacterium]